MNSDYSIEPSDRVCHPYCGDDQDQDWDISEGAGVCLIGDALDNEEGSVSAEWSGHLTKRSPLVPFPFPKKFPKKFPLKFPKKFPGKKFLKKLPLKTVKKLPLKKFKKPAKKFVAKKAPAAALTGGAGLAALPAIPAVGGLLPFLPLPLALPNFG